MRLPLAIVSSFVFATAAFAADGEATAPDERVRVWSPETLESAARIPVQDQGRIKPLSTMASFSLLRIHHKRTCRDDRGNELEPVEWLLDVLFYPEAARSYPLFRVESHEVIQAIGVPFEGKRKRDLYSYEELSVGRDRLMRQAHSFDAIDSKERTPVQSQVINLAQAVLEVERLLHYLDFARVALVVDGVAHFESSGERTQGFTAMVEAAPSLVEDLRAGGGTSRATEELLTDLSTLAQNAWGLRLFPPVVGPDENTEWSFPGEIAALAMNQRPADPRHLAMLGALEGMVVDRDRPDAFERHFATFTEESRALADARGELGKVDLEVTFYSLDLFYRGLLLSLLGFVLMAVTWLRPALRRTYLAAIVLTGGGLALTVTGIVLRCILRSRPPVSTLYETILFITAIAVAAALCIEWMDRRRIAGAMAPVLGTLGLFLAMKFEELKGVDTMPQLVAVLDTNFWLATHVTCITMGYSAGLLAAAFAHVYVLGKVFGIRRSDDAGYRTLARMVYGTLCFALIFSVVGTILGGVWANDSWGRFWGWDPKENGALMIVLSQLAILHGRMGGYLRAFGISMAAIFGGAIVAFSWWGVNLLGVGLHSYGFTDGIWQALIVFYSIEAAVLVAGGIWWFSSRMRTTPASP